jgi:uncharacterized repeat protein (TIGR03943 family)
VKPHTNVKTRVTSGMNSGVAARQAQAVVMLLLGGVVVKASVSGMYLRYVKEGLQPVLIVAGVLLISAGVMTLWYDLRRTMRPAPDHPAPDHNHDEDDEDKDKDDAARGHAHREPVVGWLLLLPVLGLLLVAPPALGSSAAGQTGSVLAAQSSVSDYAALPPGDPAQLGLLDYASRAVFDQGRSLTGRTIALTGFITPGQDGHPMIARMILACCAADARPVKVALSGDIPAGVPSDTWVRVVGVYTSTTTKDPLNDAAVPYLQVRTWQEITAPEQPYEITQPQQ